MKSISRNQWPKWIKDRFGSTKNIEIKEHNGNFYGYTYTNVWDKSKKMPRKTVKYIGSIKESFADKGIVREYGNIKFLHNIAEEEILTLITKIFPDDWKHLIVFAFNRVLYPMPIKRIPSWFEKTDLENIIGLHEISAQSLRNHLAAVGNNLGAQKEFMSSMINENELLMYDGSVIHSASKYNKLLETGYNKDKLLLPQVKITLLFSKTRKLPIYMKMFFGSIHDIGTVNEIVKELKDKKIVFVADKGFYKNKFYDSLADNKINFIMPLPRDDKRIKYFKHLDGLMSYHGRTIRYTKYVIGRFYLYIYEDQYLKYEETNEFYQFKLRKQNVEFHEDWAGKISLLSTLNLDPEEIYLMWKSRDEIEKSFHILQNILDTDAPYVSREDVFRGYIFASFLSLYLYYKVMNLIRKKELLSKLSVGDLLFELSKIMKYGDNRVVEITKKTAKVLNLLDLNYIITKSA